MSEILTAVPENDLATRIVRYEPSAQTAETVQEANIVLVSGFSGAGKGTVINGLLEMGDYHYVISHTTRAPRVNNGQLEQDGREYHFIGLETASAMLRDGAYVEAAAYSGNVYGTSVAEIERARDANQIALADIEVQGVGSYRKLKPDIPVIFLLPPSYEVWQERLLGRYDGEIDSTDYAKRMQAALRELTQVLGAPGFNFVINDDLNVTVATVDRIARTGEHELADNLRGYYVADQLRQSLEAALLRPDPKRLRAFERLRVFVRSLF